MSKYQKSILRKTFTVSAVQQLVATNCRSCVWVADPWTLQLSYLVYRAKIKTNGQHNPIVVRFWSKTLLCCFFSMTNPFKVSLLASKGSTDVHAAVHLHSDATVYRYTAAAVQL